MPAAADRSYGRWVTSFLTSPAGARALVLLSILYGVVIAVLGAYAEGAVGPFALVGALLLGLLWTARSILGRRPDQD